MSPRRKVLPSFLLLVPVIFTSTLSAAELRVGSARVDITPDRPVALDGQRHLRISREAATPITAGVVAIEAAEEGQAREQAVLISCDLVHIHPDVLKAVREKVSSRVVDIAPDRIVVTATHTHTAPVTGEGKYDIPAEGVMQPREYVEFLSDRIAEAAAEAWRTRRPAKVGWGQGHAVVGQNRRAVYADGSAQMYGNTQVPQFRGLEAREEHTVDVLFFWDAEDRLIAAAIDVWCPAQEMESLSVIHADYWHPVRETIRKDFGEQVVVLGWIGAAGDVSPHAMYEKAADERLYKLRGTTRLQELGRRIAQAFREAYEAASRDVRTDVPFRHAVEELALPYRVITAEEAEAARREMEKFADQPKERWNFLWHQRVVFRFERQQAGIQDEFTMALHVLRVGDVAVAFNPFELFTEYGLRMKARSPAVQTVVVQLAGTGDCPGGYLPTEEAVRGGGYSAVPQSTLVGPEGGQMLVDRTVELIGRLWSNP
ncbi:MAG: hypothetical protein GYA33_06505 [Thermogutta sp.]|nr:hypothetical protein [Thermogutta sp.]